MAYHPFRWTRLRHSSQHRQLVRDTGRRARCILYGLIIEAKPAELARPAERNYMFDSISWTSVGSMPHSSIMYGYTPSCSTTTTLVVDGTDASTRRAAVAAPCLFLTSHPPQLAHITSCCRRHVIQRYLHACIACLATAPAFDVPLIVGSSVIRPRSHCSGLLWWLYTASCSAS